MTKRILTLLLTLVLLLAAVPVAVPVHAEYENTHVNTGNQRYDIIQVALTQVGYQEGSKSYTKYGEYFGHPNTDWCGWFVSWCAAQAGVPNSVLRKQGIANINNYGLSSFRASEKLPQPGDLYFKSGHVGLVYRVEGDYFWSVEGNSSDQVEIEKLSLYSSRYWFGSPNYGGSNNASHTHSIETANDGSHPHKEYKYCTSCDYKSYTGNIKTVDDCTDCIQENCSHTYGSWESAGSSNHKKTCTLCGKENSVAHSWEDVQLLREATCAVTGSVSQKCDVCGATRTSSISKTNNHNYDDWEYKDDLQHRRKCTVCGKVVSKDHQVSGEEPWQTTETEHWQECSVCKEQFLLGEHTFGEDCVAPCEDCGYVRPEGHPFSEEWCTDEENHWRECTRCEELSSVEAHIYDAVCDEACNECGYIREVTHTFSDILQTDGTSHWYVCDGCGKVDGLEEHIPGEEATEEHPQLCTVCDYELAARIVHVHDFAPIYYDSQQHWGTCRCGLELGPEPHAWDMAAGACSVCGAASAAVTETQNWEFIWYIAGGVLLCGLIVAVSIIAHRSKKRRNMHSDGYWD